jgi:hypothetical protein
MEGERNARMTGVYWKTSLYATQLLNDLLAGGLPTQVDALRDAAEQPGAVTKPILGKLE